MKHFLIYHNSERWGEPVNLKQVTTNKAVDKTLGARIWVVAGRGHPRNFFLCCTFIVEKTGHDAKGGYKNWAGSQYVQSFVPPIRIDRFRWFPRFKMKFGKFQFGLQPVNAKQDILKLERLMKDPHRAAMQFKPTANQDDLEEKIQELLSAPLTEKPKGQKSPKKVETKAQSFKRDPKVGAYVLREADGQCELCKEPAPFKTDKGIPFLEVHHVRPLAKYGSDRIENAVAVCPNCHRSLHQARDSESRRAKLYRRVKRLKRE